MLKIFTIKFEEKLECFNDSMLSDFLMGKEIIHWYAHLVTRKNDYYWTVLVEYEPASYGTSSVPLDSKRKEGGEGYKDILTENDWPLFKVLRQWRGETSKKEGVPPYIIFTNMQLAKITITRPTSLNALQEINGIGNAKRERYGKDILKIVESFGSPGAGDRGGKDSG